MIPRTSTRTAWILLALPGLRASLGPSSGPLTMILRSDDPATAHEARRRAETLLASR